MHCESAKIYSQGRVTLEKQGYILKAIVLDGRPGVRQIFSDMPVQMCHFHQKQIITRYLTNNLQLQASGVLKMACKRPLCNQRGELYCCPGCPAHAVVFLSQRKNDKLHNGKMAVYP